MRLLLRFENMFALLALSALAVVLHSSALNGYWRFDDGEHLRFAATYAPWQYFFVPAITVLQSSSNLTPYNAFFYDINLALFGLAPRWHYVHLLVVIAATAWATFALVRLWQPPLVALLAGVLFLAGLPTLYIAQQLMTGHYATGLLLMVGSLWCFVRALQPSPTQHAPRWALILPGALMYCLATACKEVFVPLVLLLPLLPVGTRKARALATLPYVGVAIFYTGWRYVVLERLVGGYVAADVAWPERIRQLLNLPQLMAGPLSSSAVLLGLAGVLILLAAVTLWRANRYFWLVAAAGFLLVVLPLVPLTRNPGISNPDRYLFVVWWACSVALACMVGFLNHSGKERLAGLACACALVVLTVSAQVREHQRMAAYFDSMTVLYKTALEADDNTAIFPPPDRAYYRYILSGLRKADILLNHANKSEARIAVDSASVCAYAKEKRKILAYDAGCNCMQDFSQRTGELLAQLASKPAAAGHSAVNPIAQGPARPLSIALQMRGRLVSWQLGPHEEGTYSIVIDGGPNRVPRSGSTTYPRQEPLPFVVQYTAPDGTLVQSPTLVFDLPRQTSFSWTGMSVSPALACP